jgi:hypothetical protein
MKHGQHKFIASETAQSSSAYAIWTTIKNRQPVDAGNLQTSSNSRIEEHAVAMPPDPWFNQNKLLLLDCTSAALQTSSHF